MHFQVVEITLDVALASVGFLPIITLQCGSLERSFSDTYYYLFTPYANTYRDIGSFGIERLVGAIKKVPSFK